MNKIYVIFFSFLIFSCDKIVDSEPIWGCMDIEACNYNKFADYNGACIYPENYDECCDGIELDRCGVCGGDNSTCFSINNYTSFKYNNNDCVGGDSLEFMYDDYYLSILNHERLILTKPNLIFAYIDSIDGATIYLNNYFISSNDTINYLSTFNVLDTLSNDSILISLVSELDSDDEFLCEKSLFYSSADDIFGSINQECCNYNKFSLFNNDCEIFDCDEVCNGNNNPDCNGDCNGLAIIDECGVCSGGNSNHEFNSDKDCNDECFGSSVLDINNNCCEFMEQDCENICYGSAFEDIEDNCCEESELDNCQICSNYESVYDSEQWDTLWVDYFSSDGINSDYWNIEYWEPGRYNDELQAYTPRSENVYIEDGKLVIQALREDYTYINYLTGEEIPAQYTSARLNTKLKVDFSPINCGPYEGGEIKVDVRAKLPDGNGTWPAIWLLPTHNIYGQWPSSGEIDIMEYGPAVTGENVILSSVHTQEYNFNSPGYYESGQTNSMIIENANSEYKNYSMIWSTNSIQIFADNVEILNYQNSCAGFVSWPFSESFHLLINLAVGGHLGGSDFDNSAFPQKFYIDYVSVSRNVCFD